MADSEDRCMTPRFAALPSLPKIAVLVSLVTCSLASMPALAGSADRHPQRTDAFEREIQALRRLLVIPGLQVAVVDEDQIAFERAYGFADLKAKVPMTTDHLIEIASITKTMTGAVVMQLAAEGKLSLDDRVIKYPFYRWFYVTRITPEVRLRHVLSHTSQGVPGEAFCYQGSRFNFVYGVFGTATSESFADAVARRILDPLHMQHTFPRPGIRMTNEELAHLATPYGGFDAATGAPMPVQDPPKPREVFPSSGFFSNVKDLALYARALQKHSLLSDKSHDIMESPARTRDNRVLPYGIGCFSQTFAGQKLIWQYGYGNGSSALLLRVPAKKLALVLLANSGNMSGSTRLGYGNVLDSPFAVAFLKHFVFVRETPHASPDYDGDKAGIHAAVAGLRAKGAHPLYLQEMFTQAVIRELMAGPNQDSSKALEILQILQELSANCLSESGLTGLEVLARFDNKKLNPTTEILSRTLLREHPAHPAALYFASQFLEKTGRSDAGFKWLMQLADSGFENEELTLDACIKVGDHFAHDDPKRARAYYWRAVQLGCASSPYGSPNAKVERAIKALNDLDHR